ncbi:MAG: hypothetical protein VB064_03260 [Oscillospiraceae bacterium]|nr:hypothetical protein [Oscillospiraceae bacterium]
MNQKITAIVIVSVLSLSLLFSACGKKPAAESITPSASPELTAGPSPSAVDQYPLIVKAGSTVTSDLNGDGKEDEVYFEPNEDRTAILSLSVNGTDFAKSLYGQELYTDNLEPSYYCITDIDASDNSLEIAIMDYGPSSDYMTYFFRYDGTGLKYIGNISGMIINSFSDKSDLTFNGDGTVDSYMRLSVLQTWWSAAEWWLTDSSLELVDQDLYYPVCPSGFGEDPHTEVTALIDIIAYEKNSLSSPKSTLPAGTALTLVATDDKEWVQAKAADDKQCWIHLDSEYGQSVETPNGYVYSTDVFSGLLFAD